MGRNYKKYLVLENLDPNMGIRWQTKARLRKLEHLIKDLKHIEKEFENEKEVLQRAQHLEQVYKNLLLYYEKRDSKYFNDVKAELKEVSVEAINQEKEALSQLIENMQDIHRDLSGLKITKKEYEKRKADITNRGFEYKGHEKMGDYLILHYYDIPLITEKEEESSRKWVQYTKASYIFIKYITLFDDVLTQKDYANFAIQIKQNFENYSHYAHYADQQMCSDLDIIVKNKQYVFPNGFNSALKIFSNFYHVLVLFQQDETTVQSFLSAFNDKEIKELDKSIQILKLDKYASKKASNLLRLVAASKNMGLFHLFARNTDKKNYDTLYDICRHIMNSLNEDNYDIIYNKLNLLLKKARDAHFKDDLEIMRGFFSVIGEKINSDDIISCLDILLEKNDELFIFLPFFGKVIYKFYDDMQGNISDYFTLFMVVVIWLRRENQCGR